MLILSRKENQKIRIGNDVVINIISISENNVKIGIEADINVKIYREEVYDSIKQHTKLAADKTKDTLPTNIKSFRLNKINKNDEKK
ncbi:MAG: carbon storage regulator [Ignavibacteriae bacterium]|nr:carbon storage regulator [Ignavibacteriota bacterium]MCB9206085.1 carbon storage regulator [Ignavibacteriales bacterium]MCB9209358.1 carbon storage regulator [Ignavibacteriales bacterium]MCB9258001.1 carbon storage regulator [Ignavibacteriales bacterium]